MKTKLKELIAQSKDYFQKEHGGDFKRSINDKDIVFSSAQLAGSMLIRRDSNYLMALNAVPLKFYAKPSGEDCNINWGLKKACLHVKEYIDKEYNITPGRLRKLHEILLYKQSNFRTITDPDIGIYLKKLNDKREYASEEMTDLEIYDLTFHVLWDLSAMLSDYKGGDRLARLIMYWIQLENGLIPIAMECDRESYENAFNVAAKENKEDDRRKVFRRFMRKLLESHLKKFIKRAKGKDISTSRDRILDLVKNNPKHTARTMAVKLGMSIQGVQKQIAILKAEKRLVRIGSDRNGRWKVC